MKRGVETVSLVMSGVSLAVWACAGSGVVHDAPIVVAPIASRQPAVDGSAVATQVHSAAPPVEDAAAPLVCNAHVVDPPVLTHRKTLPKSWDWTKEQCPEACVATQSVGPDSTELRYHLVIRSPGGGFDVSEDVGPQAMPMRCGQGMTSADVIPGEPFHLRLWIFSQAGVAVETNDAGETVEIPSMCGAEGAESDYTDVFVDRAHHRSLAAVTQHVSGSDPDAKVEMSAGVVRISGGGCDEQVPVGKSLFVEGGGSVIAPSGREPGAALALGTPDTIPSCGRRDRRAG